MKPRKLVYWCVPNKDSGYNKRFETRREAFQFWRDNKQNYHEWSKPGKVEIQYWSIFGLVDNCLAGESTVQEPYFDEDQAFDREVEDVMCDDE